MKLPAAFNINNFEIMDHSITDDDVNDAKEGRSILIGIMNMVSRLFWDNVYDSNQFTIY